MYHIAVVPHTRLDHASRIYTSRAEISCRSDLMYLPFAGIVRKTVPSGVDKERPSKKLC